MLCGNDGADNPVAMELRIDSVHGLGVVPVRVWPQVQCGQVGTTPSGLSYLLLGRDRGAPKPGSGDGVWVSYRATEIDGTLLEASPGTRLWIRTDSGEQEAIPGLLEAVQLTPMGSSIRAIIPPGADRRGTLLLQVEILEIMHPCLSGKAGHRHHVDQPQMTWWPCVPRPAETAPTATLGISETPTQEGS